MGLLLRKGVTVRVVSHSALKCAEMEEGGTQRRQRRNPGIDFAQL